MTEAAADGDAQPIPIRVVIVTMYESIGETDTEVGEYRIWADRPAFAERLPFPISDEPLALDRSRGVLVVNTGVGTARAAATITALGLDPRFDLTRSYWLVAGVAGGNARLVPLASACWAEWVVDGDLAHQIDGREIPADWDTGFIPLFRSRPYEQPRPSDQWGNVYHLDPGLVDWAYQLTRNVAITPPVGLEAWLATFSASEAAAKPPIVMKGDTLSTATFWHGHWMNDWASDWVRYWTDGAGTFATSAMEDTGTLAALTRLAVAGRVDRDRVLVLRTTSNFTAQPDEQTAAESLAVESASFSAKGAAVEAAYAVGRVVVDEIVDTWDRAAATIPRT
ncbi:hypothetical protein [Bauldia sp.]|uniref:hypothetical protein n=1 Tax=Bauldia sp. TaxID=2575872 RepID=UPI003BAB56AE